MLQSDQITEREREREKKEKERERKQEKLSYSLQVFLGKPFFF